MTAAAPPPNPSPPAGHGAPEEAAPIEEAAPTEAAAPAPTGAAPSAALDPQPAPLDPQKESAPALEPAPPDGTSGASPPPGDESDPPGEKRMSIWEHLDELRKRIVWAAVGVLVTTIAAWTFREKLLAWAVAPYQRTWMTRFHKPLVLQTLAPTDPFLGYFELSLTAGIVCASPIIFYQLWAFISPGLYKKEKRLIVPFVLMSTSLFVSGIFFAYYVAFPFTFTYFLSLLGQVSEGVELTQIVTLGFFLDFVTRFLLAFGAVFELPLFIAFLVLANIVTPRQLLKFGRWAVVLSFIVGAIVTPGPEVTSQLAVSLALIGLYFASIPIAYLLKPRAKKPDDDTKPDDEKKPDDDKKG
jgi:sec-independent protein translocase protein TatC